MNTISNLTPQPAYWDVLKNLNDNEKMDLIIYLTQSLKQSNQERKISAKEFYGIWGDDGMSDEEFIKELKAERAFRQDIIEV